MGNVTLLFGVVWLLHLHIIVKASLEISHSGKKLRGNNPDRKIVGSGTVLWLELELSKAR